MTGLFSPELLQPRVPAARAFLEAHATFASLDDSVPELTPASQSMTIALTPRSALGPGALPAEVGLLANDALLPGAVLDALCARLLADITRANQVLTRVEGSRRRSDGTR